jgi:Tfp pilus assembly protein PilO
MGIFLQVLLGYLVGALITIVALEWLERKKEQELEEARREAEKLRQAYIKRRETK